MLKSQIQLSQSDRCQTQRPKEFKQSRPYQRLASHGFPARKRRGSQKPARSQALIGRFESVAEFGTGHIEKAVFVTSASIFSETVGGMKLKFAETEIEKKLIYQDPSPFR